jgi:hypothetical protein
LEEARREIRAALAELFRADDERAMSREIWNGFDEAVRTDKGDCPSIRTSGSAYPQIGRQIDMKTQTEILVHAAIGTVAFGMSGGCQPTFDDGDAGECAAAMPCDGDYIVENGSDLDDVALCSTISGTLRVNGKDWLGTIGLPCLESVGAGVDVQNNPALLDIDLSSLESSQRVAIAGNAGLLNLDGLSSLASVEFGFGILNNGALTDISGLASLASVGGTLEVTGNTVLCQSVVDAVIQGCGDCPTVRTSSNDDGC